MSGEVRFFVLYLKKEMWFMNGRFLKKTAAAVMAAALVGGALPAVSGSANMFDNAIVAEAAEIGSIINFGENIGDYPGYYASADGRTVQMLGLEVELIDYGYYYENTRIGVAYPQTEYESENTDILVSVPAGRELEVPTGVKIIAGTGNQNDPYQLELIYGEPMGDFQEVAVGTKWYIGDIINTNAYFTVSLVASDTMFDDYYTYPITGRFLRKELSAPELYNGRCYNGRDEDFAMFKNVVSVISEDWIQIKNNGKHVIVCDGEKDKPAYICFEGNPTSIIGIEVVDGIGTEDEPFILAPIIDENIMTISFSSEGTGYMPNGYTDDNGEYTLPECTFNAPEGTTFKGWKIGDTIYQPGDTITPTEDITAVAVWGRDNKVTGASVSLDGAIGVNFYSELNYDTAKAVLSGPNGDIEITDLESVKQENGDYKFSYPVYSNQAAEKVSLSFFDADGNQLDVYNSSGELDEDKAIEFSVNDYIAGYEASTNTKQNDLVAALDNYCKAADNYFNGAGNTVEGISGINYNSVKGYAPTLCGNKMALLLNADTSIRIFYNGDAEQANLNYGDALLTKITKGEKSYFEIPNISADKLSEEFVLVIGDDELEFSALSYSALALKKTTDQNLWNLSKALCVYADAAKAYKESL